MSSAPPAGGVRLRAALLLVPALLVSPLATRALAAGATVTPNHCDALLQDASGNQSLQPESSFPPSSPEYYPAVADPATGYSRHYCLFVPSTYDLRRGGPLVMVLHGCYTDAPTAAYETGFNAEAERQGFIAVYPQEAAFTTDTANSAHPYDGNGSGPRKGSGCWNWFLPDQLQRGSPEPAILAGIARQVMTQFHVDGRRVFVIGLSAGAAEADLLGVLYPDLFAAAAVVAGCEYDGAACLGSSSALPPQASGLLAFKAAAGHARVVPYLVENGDIDPVVPLHNALNDVQQWQTYDALAAGASPAAAAAPVAPCARASQPVGPLGAPNTSDPVANPNAAHAYDVLYYSLDGSSCAPGPGTLGQLWVVHGELHAYPGGAARRYYTTEDTYYDIWTDPLGPDFTDVAYRFFVAHPCQLRHGACAG